MDFAFFERFVRRSRSTAAAVLLAASAARVSLTADAATGPPAAQIPIVFNDRHVPAGGDRLRGGRVLAALARGNTILVPLRSVFERMGAAVSFDPAAKTVHVTKPGADLRLTVGRPEVTLNGETRPLDVPPEIDAGSVLVPVRVVSEGMGAYVQWMPARRTVVIRYAAAAVPTPAPPPPTPYPTEAPIVTATATPVPAATARSRPRARAERFVVGDYLVSPRIYNEFSPGNTGLGTSYAIRGAIEFRLIGLPLMVAGDGRSYHYPHNAGSRIAGDQGFVTVIGGYGQTFVPAFGARDTDVEGQFGIKVLHPRIYVGAGYLHREQNTGYPKQNGVGFGIQKLPDLDHRFSVYGSAYYYPSVTGSYLFVNQDPIAIARGLSGSTVTLGDRILTYQIGGSLMLAGADSELGLFLDGGYLGDSVHAGNLAPSNAAHRSGYLGLGLKF